MKLEIKLNDVDPISTSGHIATVTEWFGLSVTTYEKLKDGHWMDKATGYYADTYLHKQLNDATIAKLCLFARRLK